MNKEIKVDDDFDENEITINFIPTNNLNYKFFKKNKIMLKKIQLTLVAVMTVFMFSCDDDKNPVGPGGGIDYSPGNVYIGSTKYATIDLALGAAVAGDEILLCEGVYTVSSTYAAINKDLKIKGIMNNAVIEAITPAVQTLPGGSDKGANPIFFITAGNVSFENVTFKTNRTPVQYTPVDGLTITGGSLTLKNVTFDGIYNHEGIEAMQHGRCVTVYGATTRLTVANSTFKNFNKNGIHMMEGNATVTNSNFTGSNMMNNGAIIGQNGIVFMAGTTGTVTGCNFKDFNYDDDTACGVLDYTVDVAVDGGGNTYSNNDFNWLDAHTYGSIAIGTTTYPTIDAAIAAAAAGDIISLGVGIYPVTATIDVNKDVTIKGIEGATKFTVSGGTTVFNLSAVGATLDGISIIKTDKTNAALITITSNDVTIKNSKFTGQYVLGDGEVARGLTMNAGVTGFVIDGNHFENLRQPGYIEGVGEITNNYVTGTRGWVITENHLLTALTGNTFGENAVDIAIIANGGTGSNYTDVVAISVANDGAFVENQVAGIKAKDGVIIP